MGINNREVVIAASAAVVSVVCYEVVRQKIFVAVRARVYRERFGKPSVTSWWWLRLLRALREAAHAERSKLLRQQHNGSQVVPPRASLPAEMVCEMLSRHEAFFGAEGHARVRGSRACVVGLGGVGSHAAMMLGRAGVRSLRVVDFDHVSLSSLNRHAVAGLRDVGTLKTATVEAALIDAAPFVSVDARPVMFTADTADDLLEGPLDLVLDCIDDIDTKAALLRACAARGLRVLSALGAGAKADPTRLRVAPLADAVHDPLASKLRWKLRDVVDSDHIQCVYSYDRPRCSLLPLTDEQIERGARNYGAVDVDHFRVRVLPVLGASPALMGQAMAAVSLCGLAGAPVSPAPREPLSKKLKERMLARLKKREARRELGPKTPPEKCEWLDALHEELEYVCAEVWRGRCAVTRAKIERKPLSLARWWGSRRGFGRRPKGPDAPMVLADELILLAPHLADALDAALDDLADANPAPERADLFRAAAAALGGPRQAALVDARIAQMRDAAGGPWFDPLKKKS